MNEGGNGLAKRKRSGALRTAQRKYKKAWFTEPVAFDTGFSVLREVWVWAFKGGSGTSDKAAHYNVVSPASQWKKPIKSA